MMKTKMKGAGRWLAATAILSASLPALACKFIPDERPLARRLESEPVVFVGTVLSADKDRTVFAVKGSARGVKGDSYEAKGPGSSCDIRFGVGQIWLYAGGSVTSPSAMLSLWSAGKLIEQAKVIRHDDSALQLPPQWQRCETGSECAPVFYGCSSTAANKKFAEQARKAAIGKTSDPSRIECGKFSPKGLWADVPMCSKGMCGMWTVHAAKKEAPKRNGSGETKQKEKTGN